jgi:urease accessory protein
MAWHARLSIDYTLDPTGRCIGQDRHEGPLRVLQRLVPEGEGICHHVMVHPPGGIVGGDVLDVDLGLAPGTHAVLTTPGATRFYRSAGAPARQGVRARVDAGARLEWLPLETIAYSGCEAQNWQRFELAPGAAMIGWDLCALGLPAADEGFERGRLHQRLELPGIWLEEGRIAATDRALLDSPVGLDGRRVFGTLWFAQGRALGGPLREALLGAAREAAEAGPLARHAGATAAHEEVVVLRVLAHRVEPAMALFQQVRDRWREAAWGLPRCHPRVWST